MRKEHTYFVYILASKKNGTLYTGVTNNLLKRILEHKEKIIPGFTSRYNINKLVYFEVFKYVNDAIRRETLIKTWKRKWKLELIEQKNFDWNDLFYDLFDADEIESTRKYLVAGKSDRRFN